MNLGFVDIEEKGANIGKWGLGGLGVWDGGLGMIDGLIRPADSRYWGNMGVWRVLGFGDCWGVA